MMLTDEDRKRFAAWLRQEAASNQALAEQTSKLSLPSAVIDHLVSRKKILAVAELLVASELEAMESQTIRGPTQERK